MPSRTVTGGTTDEAGHSASTTLTVFSITGRHLRTSAPQGIPGIWQVKLLEIVDSQGKVVKTVCEDTPRGVMRVFAAKEGQAYAVFEWDHRPGRGGAAAVLRYFDAAGDLKWSADICCGNTLPEFLVRMADDGSVVTIKDRTEGDACEIGEDYERVAKGCVGLRVFTSEGVELMGVPKGDFPCISPHGRYVVFSDGSQYMLLNAATRKLVKLPDVRIRSPHGVADDGTVRYFSEDYEPPELPRYTFHPVRGLERLK